MPGIVDVGGFDHLTGKVEQVTSIWGFKSGTRNLAITQKLSYRSGTQIWHERSSFEKWV